MNLIKVTNADGVTTHLNKDNIVRVYRHTFSTKIFRGGVQSRESIVAVQNVADFPCVSTQYDEGLWNNFLLSAGWIQSKDEKSIVNCRWVNSIVEYDDIYMIYVTEKYHVNNGYIGSRYLGIEITRREFYRIK